MAKKKKSRTLVALLLVLVLLIGTYVYYVIYIGKQEEQEASNTTEDEAIQILSIEAANIQSIYYKNNQAELTLIKNTEDAWVIETNQDVPLNSTYTNKMASTVENLTASKIVVENAEDLSQYGLTNPLITIIIMKVDGSQETLYIGDESPLGDGYYACLKGNSSIYLVDTAVYSAYNYNESSLFTVASAPTMEAGTITHLLVEDQETGVLEITYDVDNEYDHSNTGIAPYVLNQAYTSPVSGDTTNITTYLGNFTNLSYKECVEYNSEDFAKYGLDNPSKKVTVDYYEDVEVQSEADTEADSEQSSSNQTERNYYKYVLLIGNLDETNSVYYVKEADSNSIYTMSQSIVEGMLTYQRFELASKYAQIVNVSSVDQVDVSFGGDTHSLAIKHTTTKDEEGNEEDVDVFYLDGKEYDESKARTIYQTLISQMYSTEIPEDYVDSNQDPIVTFVFNRSDESGKADIVSEYREYDASFYTVAVNGVELFLVDKRDVQKAMEAIQDQVSE